MAVRVVSDEPINPRKIVCRNCQRLLEFTGEDIQYSSLLNSDFSYVSCPRCKKQNEVNPYSRDKDYKEDR